MLCFHFILLVSSDSHPTSSLNSLILTVGGTVTYGLDSSEPKGFFHSFVLEKDIANSTKACHYIVSGSCRERRKEESSSGGGGGGMGGPRTKKFY